MTLDPFYLLLLIELVLIQSAIIAFLYLRGRKLQKEKAGGKNTATEPEGKPMSDSEEAALNQVEVQQFDPRIQGLMEIGEIKKQDPGPAEAGSEMDNLKNLVDEKVNIILQMKKKIEEMEKKYVDMEQEYLILFDQSQKQEEALRAYGVKKPDSTDF